MTELDKTKEDLQLARRIIVNQREQIDNDFAKKIYLDVIKHLAVGNFSLATDKTANENDRKEAQNKVKLFETEARARIKAFNKFFNTDN